ncbi:hypothetical protein H6G97_27775 [Nostoc flagelliforme FACHB-838]|uniref:Twin-arginine translocation signal domain-containing protein n=1 Tax=Nostoc flagelliforme FACHB-838 TaxID=2692904 RepID=A0ABR8DW76_9NOSO|nr:hypothetical protein [Nostoc flagelliforme]MBD2533165.1 hypothetical protein [Nostoc flagelliforme FACHB-838]
MFNNHSRRQFLQLAGGLLVATSATVSFPRFRTLAADKSKPILRFQFTIEGGGKGSFYLNTAAAPIAVQGAFGQEFLYFNAVSNFSFSGLDRNLKKQTAGWKVVPGLKAEFLGGFPPGTPGILSGVNYPDGCSTGTANACSITVAVLYLGNLAELPQLSTDPSSYYLIGVDLIQPNGQLNRIDATERKVIALPEGVIVD